MEIVVDSEEPRIIKDLVKREVKKSKYPHTVVTNRRATDEVGDFEIADHYGTIRLKLERKTYPDLISSIRSKDRRWERQTHGLLGYHELHPSCQVGILIEDQKGVAHAAAQVPVKAGVCRPTLPLEKLNDLQWHNPHMLRIVTTTPEHTARIIIELADDLALSMSTNMLSANSGPPAAGHGQMSVKKRVHESGDLFASQLSMCNGLSSNAAAAIRTTYPNWYKLVAGIVKHRRLKTKKPLFFGLSYRQPKGTVKMGEKLAQRIEEFIMGEGN